MQRFCYCWAGSNTTFFHNKMTNIFLGSYVRGFSGPRSNKKSLISKNPTLCFFRPASYDTYYYAIVGHYTFLWVSGDFLIHSVGSKNNSLRVAITALLPPPPPTHNATIHKALRNLWLTIPICRLPQGLNIKSWISPARIVFGLSGSRMISPLSVRKCHEGNPIRSFYLFNFANSKVRIHHVSRS